MRNLPFQIVIFLVVPFNKIPLFFKDLLTFMILTFPVPRIVGPGKIFLGFSKNFLETSAIFITSLSDTL